VHCGAAGKALLAFLPQSELDSIIRKRGLKSYTSKTIKSVKRLKQELRLVHERGYAIDNEEFEEGLRCVGAPLRDHTGEVVAAISIAGPAFRIRDERLPEIVRFVVDAAMDLSRELGYRGSKAEARLSF
jgi:IclR family acetate operon transcriptional repressor